MITSQLLDYIKQQLGQGINKEQIKSDLLSQGWQEDDVEEGFKRVEADISNDSSNLLAKNLKASRLSVTNQSSESQSSARLVPRQSLNDVFKNNQNLKENFRSKDLPSAWELLEKSWQIFKKRWDTLIVFPFIPIAVNLLIAILIKESNVFSNVSIFSITLLLLLIAIGIIVYFWSIVSLFYAVNDEDLSVKEALGEGWYEIIPHRIISFWWISFLVGTIIVGGIALFIVPGIIFSVWFSLAIIVFIAEGVKGMNALLKSREYVRDYWWSVFGRLLFLLVILLTPFFLIIGMVYLIWSLNEVTSNLNLIGNLYNLATLPLSTIYLFQIYYSLRNIKKDFVFTPSRKTKIWFIIVGIVGIIVIPLGIFGWIVLVNVDKAREKAEIISVQISLSQLRPMGEIYADNHYNSYDGFVGSNCSSGSPDWQKICRQATKNGFLAKGYDSQDSYCVVASSKGKNLCVDSSGYIGIGKCIGQGTKDNPYQCQRKQPLRINDKIDRENTNLPNKNRLIGNHQVSPINNNREKPNIQSKLWDTSIISNMHGLIQEAEFYYDDNKESYTGFSCKSNSEASHNCNEIKKIRGITPTIYAQGNKYCFYIKLFSGDYYCIDSNRKTLRTTINPSGSGYCNGVTFVCPPAK